MAGWVVANSNMLHQLYRLLCKISSQDNYVLCELGSVCKEAVLNYLSMYPSFTYNYNR